MNSHDWQSVFGEPNEEFHLHLTKTLDHLEEKEMKKRYKISSVLVAAMLMLVLLAGAGFAASQLGVFDILNTADPIIPLEGAEKLVGTNLGITENEYVTLCVEEAVFDGQGVLVKCRLTPKDKENHALYDAMMLDASEDVYYIERIPCKAAEGSQSWSDGENEYHLINENGVIQYLVNGEEAEIPSSFEEAEERRMDFYIQDSVLYYTGYDWNVLGRKDGKEMLDFWLEFKSEIFMDTHNAREDADGSIVWWASGIADEILDVDEIEMRICAWIKTGEKQIYTPEISVILPRSEEQRIYDFTPEVSACGEELEILSAKMICTKVRGYVKIDFRSPKGAELDIDLSVCDADGKAMKLGSGSCWEEDGVYHWQMEMQSLEEVPEKLLLEARCIGEAQTTAKFECRVTEE